MTTLRKVDIEQTADGFTVTGFRRRGRGDGWTGIALSVAPSVVTGTYELVRVEAAMPFERAAIVARRFIHAPESVITALFGYELS